MRNRRDGWSVESAEKKGRPLPDWYLDEPEIPVNSELFQQAFLDLGTERQLGPEGILGPIPWSRCALYVRAKAMPPELGEAVWEVVRRMDAAEAAWHAEDMRARTDGKLSHRRGDRPVEGDEREG